MNPLPGLLDIPEAAARMRCSVKTIHRWEKKGFIKFFRCGRESKVREDSLIKHVERFSK